MSEGTIQFGQAPGLAECIIRTVREPLVVLDADLKVVFASDAFYRVFRIKPEETVGRHIYELGSGEWSEDGLRRLLEDIIPENKAFDEYLVDHDFPRIGRRIMKLNGRKVEQAGNNRELILLAIEDITERKRAEKRLEDIDRLVENAPDLIARLDLQKRYRYVNRAFEKHAGLPREKIVGKTPGVLGLPSESVRTINAALDSVIGTGQEATVALPAGGREYQTRIVPETGERGSPVSIISVARDITAMKEMEETLRTSEETFRSLARNLPDIVARYGCDFRYRYINPAGERLFGKPRDEIIGRTNAELGLPEKIVSFLHGNFKTICETKKGMTLEFNVPFPGGERCLSSRMAPEFDARGNVVSLLSINRDITSQKETERYLRESEEKYRTLVERSNDGITIIQDGLVVFANRRMAEQAGSTVEQLVGTPFTDHVYPGEKAKIRENYRRRMAGRGVPKPYETVLRRRNGEPAPVEVNASLITFRGKPADMIIIRDISERRKAEEALRESEERFRTLVEASPNAITYTDTQGKILYTNDKTPEMFRHKDVNEVIGTSAFSLIDPADRPRAMANLKRTVETGATENLEYLMVRKDGSTFPGEVSARAIRDRQGRLTGFIGITRDITRRKAVSEKLARREEEFRTLAENSPEFILRFDRECRFLYVNPRGAALFGLPAEAMVGKRSTDLGRPKEEAGFWESHIGDVFASRKEKTFEYAETAGGKKAYFNAFLVPELSREGGVSSVLAISRDVTREKEAEKQLTEALALARTRAREAGEGQQVLMALMDNIAEGLLITDARGKIRFLSRYLARVAGVSPEEAHGKDVSVIDEKLGLPVEPLLPRRDYPIARALNRGEATTAEERDIRSPEGNAMTVLINAQPIRGADGTIIGALESWRDITERKRAENALRRNEYELRTLVDNSPDIIIRFDRNMRYAYVNPAFERITGIAREDFAGRTNEELGMPKERREVWEGAARDVFASGRDGTVEFDMTSFFGKRYFSGRVIPEFARDGSVETVMIIARDITERKRYEEKIRFISFHDAVTGLYNRAYYEEELRRIDTERELPISIIMGDVNNLKLSNDVLGHEEGDRLLKTIAAAIQRACRKNDIVARWGGDEFAVLLPGTDLATAEGIRSRIRQIAGESPGTVVRPSVALGAAVKDRREQNINAVVRRAEEMMYADKMAAGKKNEENVISSLLNRAQERSQDITVHAARSCDLARRFGKALGLSEEQELDLELIIRLHDIGMAAVPREVLTKPGRLTGDEWKLVQKHPEAGFEIVRSFADTARISDEILAHDEHWDGSGYPRGLAGGKIPYLARVFALIEAYDVMTHPRPYARTLTPEEAVEELQRGAGSQFDPVLVKVFVRLVSPAKAPA